MGGSRNGAYVNSAALSVPSYEYFPPAGPPIISPFLENTLPVNLYPLTWLLPSGKLLVQAAFSTILLDRKNNVETPLDDMPHAVRVYPASAGTFMMPLTPANNWTATIMFCGGSNIANEEYDHTSHYLKMANYNSLDGHLPTSWPLLGRHRLLALR